MRAPLRPCAIKWTEETRHKRGNFYDCLTWSIHSVYPTIRTSNACVTSRLDIKQPITVSEFKKNSEEKKSIIDSIRTVMLKKCAILILVIGVLLGGWYKRKTNSEVFVTLDYGSFYGKRSHVHGLEQFLGIPFAEASRFNNPTPPTRTYWKHDSTKHGPVCPQQTLGGNVSSMYKDWFDNLELNPLEHLKPFGGGQEEGCLNLDVTRPAGLKEGSKLPVMHFIFPGGFNYGASWELSGLPIVKKSIELGLPIIWVSANHRTN
ncbi:hypothetical protein CROQUDRAFT_100469, partial [Cronartium quercuum f. sp. fusiforme G11]